MPRRLAHAAAACVAAALVLAFALHPGPAAGLLVQPHGARSCLPPGPTGTQRCRAGLTPPQIQRIQQTQERAGWCWAAAAAMVFSHYDAAVTQEQIVSRHFGALIDRRITGSALTHLMNKVWIDASGNPFASSARADDPHAGQFEVSSIDMVVADLANNHPMILGAEGHMVVLVEVHYEQAADGALRVTGGTVIDPEQGQGVRPLRIAELRPNYIASIRVEPLGSFERIAPRLLD
jgi:hypothetical protein